MAHRKAILGNADFQLIASNTIDDLAGGILGPDDPEGGRNPHTDIVAAVVRYNEWIQVHQRDVDGPEELFDTELIQDRLEQALDGKLRHGQGRLMFDSAKAGHRGQEHDVAVIVAFHFW